MIAFDTNALVRMLIEDDPKQAGIVRDIVTHAEENAERILILPEVLIETVWVLESAYHCTRKEIAGFLDALLHSSVFMCDNASTIRTAISQYGKSGDFADLLIVQQAKRCGAARLISFDRKLQKAFPDFVAGAKPS